MNAVTLLAALLVGLGLALVGTGLLGRRRSGDRELAELLDLPWDGDAGATGGSSDGGGDRRSPLLEDTIGLAARVVDQFDAKGSLQAQLERARLPLRAGELVVAAIGGAVVLGLLVAAVTDAWLFGLGAAAATPFLVRAWLARRVDRRRQAFEAQLPEALSIIASSLSAGHTFLRAIQMMCEEASAPLSEEFERVVAETRLGDPVVDALGRMAERLDVTDLTWVVQAVRIQQQVGGALAELLHTLADFMRSREEIRREIDVLTAEGRISAWVLGALPVFLLVAVQVSSPGYLEPLMQGWGLGVLAMTAASVVTGIAVIRRMVRIEV